MSYQSFDQVQNLTPNATSTNKLPLNDVEKYLNQERSIVIFGRDLNMTKTQLLTFILLSSYFFLSAAYYSLLAPFFPSEATRKKLSETQVGIIFGVFEFVIFILSPFFGKNLEHFGIRFLFVSGLFIKSGSQFLFGFLHLCPEGLTFFFMCIACRAVTGIGESMGLSFAIISHYFPDRALFFISLLELFYGLGFMIGPVIGGFLYELGGFHTPFIVVGGLSTLQFITAYLFFPDARSLAEPRESLPIIPFLKSMRFILTLLLIFMCAVSIGFTQPSIQLHLLPLGLSPLQIATIMMFPSLIYMVSTPIIGYFCDKYKNSMKSIMFVSTLLMGVSFSLIGPIPILKMPLTLPILIIGYLAFGLGIGGLSIPGYSELLRITMKRGYENDLRTQGVISGIFSSIWSFGSLVGPIIGGYAVDMIGFNQATMFLVLAFLISAFMSIIFLIKDCIRTGCTVNEFRVEESETRPLL